MTERTCPCGQPKRPGGKRYCDACLEQIYDASLVDSPTGICVVAICAKSTFAKGRCKTHYELFRAHFKPTEKCSEEDCHKPAEKRGWCGMHYRRLRVHSDLNQGRLTPAERTEKPCSQCGEIKPMSEFYPMNLQGEGEMSGFYIGYCRTRFYSSLCKGCDRVTAEARRQADLERDLTRKRNYYERNRDYFLVLDRARYWADPEKAREAKRLDYERHKPKRRAAVKAWKRTHREQWNAMQRLNRARRKAAKVSVGVRVTQAQIMAKVVYWGDRCWMCHGPWCEMDHVKPITKGGAHMLCNLRPICRPCNARKNARWPLERLL